MRDLRAVDVQSDDVKIVSDFLVYGACSFLQIWLVERRPRARFFTCTGTDVAVST